MSRAFNDFVIDQLQQERQENIRLLEQVGTLGQHLMDLKANGATTPDQRPTLQKRKPDTVMSVIADVAGRDSGLRRHLGKYVREQRAAGVDDQEILQTLQHWPSEEDDAA